MEDKIKKILKKEPNLKAKDIAKKLKCSTTEVNKILHYTPDVFEQDKALFTWNLVELNKTKVTFSPKWITCDLFEKNLKDSGLDVDNTKEIIFILPEDCKFLIEASARLLALCNQLAEKEYDATIDLSENSKSLHYLNRAGFFDQLNDRVNVLPKRPKHSTAKSHKGNSKSVVEFGAVDPTRGNKDLVNQLTDAFITLSSDKYQDPAFTIFSELITNVKDHSKSSLKGFAALQFYSPPKKPSHIQTVVSDSGVGIVTTLRPHLRKFYPELENLSDSELVKKVMTEGRITQHGKASGRGLGFEASSKKALKYNAKYSVRQQDFSLDFIIRNGSLVDVVENKDLVKIFGTHICFDFDIDESGSAD